VASPTWRGVQGHTRQRKLIGDRWRERERPREHPEKAGRTGLCWRIWGCRGEGFRNDAGTATRKLDTHPRNES
jgi:hypothetical protein